MITAEARFWSKVERRRGCWVWKARVDRGGYGIFSVSRNTLVRAHRFSWELLRGRLRGPGCLLHRCTERRCVNPSHLYVGSAHESHTPHQTAAATATRPTPGARRPRGRQHWTHRKPAKVRRGERSNLSKLRASQVLQIRALHARGVSVDELAARFRVVRETVGNIVRFRTWRDLGGARRRASHHA